MTSQTTEPPNSRLTHELAMNCAKEFARGVAEDLWAPIFNVERQSDGGENWRNVGYSVHVQNFQKYLNGELWPPASLINAAHLEVFGYFERLPPPTNSTPGLATTEYILTPKALKLLDAPETSPSVFIAYKRETSSCLALLLEARLKSVGIETYIDKDLKGGEEWNEVIRKKIQEDIQFFIGVVGNNTLEGPNIQNEIRWAYEVRERVLSIPLWHPNYRPPTSQELSSHHDAVQYFIRDQNAIRVTEESAREYDTAIQQVLDVLGFVMRSIPSI